MDFSKLADRAKEMIGKRGGMDSVKEDASELKDVAGKDESLADKAKDAAPAVEDPGAPGETPPSA
jgi:hypothetical protein